MPGEFFTDNICITLACSEKYTYDVRHTLHTFVHVVSEAIAGRSY